MKTRFVFQKVWLRISLLNDQLGGISMSFVLTKFRFMVFTVTYFTFPFGLTISTTAFVAWSRFILRCYSIRILVFRIIVGLFRRTNHVVNIIRICHCWPVIGFDVIIDNRRFSGKGNFYGLIKYGILMCGILFKKTFK